MEINKATVGVLAAICIGAGAGGAYLATRGSSAASVSQEIPDVSSNSAVSGGAVEQSEAIVTEPPASVPPPVTPPATVPARGRTQAAPPARAAATRVNRDSQPVAARPSPARPTSEPTQPAPPREEARTPVPPPLEPVRPVEAPAVVRVPEPPVPEFEDLVVSVDSVIGLQVETSITSERARVEDEVVARVTRDVRVGDRVAIPAGAKAHGEVTLVERGGKVRERARLGVRFTSVVLADGTRIPLETDTIYREGDAVAGESTAKIGGGAIGGAILGGILGGAKGAILGGSAGAAAGTAAVVAGGRNPATLPSGAPVTVRLTKPATVTVEK